MSEQGLTLLGQSSAVISLFAVVVIVAGFCLAAGRYAVRYRVTPLKENFRYFRIQLGGALTLGLEILVLADVIETITVPPSFQSLGVLAFLVGVRTVVSWTLILETEGHWPWQSAAEDDVEQAHA